MPRFYPLLLTALLSAASVAAQPTFRLGLRGGLNRATSTIAPASTSPSSQYYYSASKSAIYAWQAGAVLEVTFHRFSLQPTLVFSQKGEQFDATTSISGIAGVSGTVISAVNRYNWLELPVNVVYALHGFQVFAGPYVALGVGGRQHGTISDFSPYYTRLMPQYVDKKVAYDSDSNNRRLDAGINVGIGYRKGPLQVQLGYGLGLRNLHQNNPYQLYNHGYDFNQDAAYNRVVQLTGTYFFKL